MDFDLSAIKDWQNVCSKGDGTIHPVTKAIVMSAHMVGMNEITEENLKEFTTRVTMYERLFGYPLKGSLGPIPLEYKDFQTHVGLKIDTWPMSHEEFLQTIWRLWVEKLEKG